MANRKFEFTYVTYVIFLLDIDVLDLFSEIPYIEENIFFLIFFLKDA